MKKALIFLSVFFIVVLITTACTKSTPKTAGTSSSTSSTPSTSGYTSTSSSSTSSTSGTTSSSSTGDSGTVSAKNTIEITSSGFNPKTLTIKSGETVIFLNKDSAAHWPASARHPTHEVYPESGGCISSAFDACEGLKQGESFSFTFTQTGSWNYHDHLNPSLFGTIIVQ